MKNKHAMNALLFLVISVAPMTAETDHDRALRLENQLVSPCCYSEPVARHMSETAIKMREEIKQRVSEGQSDQEILDHYRELYGIRVLAEPPGTSGWILYIAPIAAVVLGNLVVYSLIKAWTRRPQEHKASSLALSDEYRVKLEQELRDLDS